MDHDVCVILKDSKRLYAEVKDHWHHYEAIGNYGLRSRVTHKDLLKSLNPILEEKPVSIMQ